jgi:hypothetical protein
MYSVARKAIVRGPMPRRKLVDNARAAFDDSWTLGASAVRFSPA